MIPVVCGVTGGILGVAGMYLIPEFPAGDVINAAAIGIVSGLASTGVHQVIKQVGKNKGGTVYMRDIALCHPRMQKIAAQWITACKAEGINVAISETLRTAAEQDALYAKGRTKPGNIVTNAKGSSYRSQHQWGIAFDFI